MQISTDETCITFFIRDNGTFHRGQKNRNCGYPRARLAAKFYYAQTTLVLVRWWHHASLPLPTSLFVANRRRRRRHSKSFVYAPLSRKNFAAHDPATFFPRPSSTVTSSTSSSSSSSSFFSSFEIKFQKGKKGERYFQFAWNFLTYARLWRNHVVRVIIELLFHHNFSNYRSWLSLLLYICTYSMF